MDEMTIKEVSDVLRISEITIRRSIQKIFPDLLVNGKKTLLNEYHVTAIKNDITSKHLDKNVEVKTDLEKKIIIKQAIYYLNEEIETLKEQLQIRENQIKRLVHAKKLYTTTEIAKELNFKSAQELNNILKDKNIQYQSNGTWVLKADYSDSGYESIKQMELDNGTIIYDRKWTGTGRDFLVEMFHE